MKVPRLPDDIVGLIIDELATVLVSESRDEAEKDACARDLAACARTAYVFLPYARAKLYKRVELAYRESPALTRSQREAGAGEARLTSRSSKVLFALALNPHLAENVRIVIVDVMVMAGRPPFRIERYMVATAVANLLRIAPNVTTLSVKVCYPDDALFFLQPLYLVLQGSKPALRNLGIMVLHRNHITQPITSLFLDISQLFPELNGLQLSGIPFGGVAGSVNPAPFKLRTLSFDADGQGDGSDDVFKWVTGQSLQSMEHLELYGFAELDLQPLVSLTSLCFTLDEPSKSAGRSEDRGWSVEKSVEVITAVITSASPTLRALRIGGRRFPRDAFDEAFFEAVPRTIESVILVGVPVYTSALLGLLSGYEKHGYFLRFFGCTDSQIEPTAQVTLSDLESGFYEAYVSWVGYHD